MKAPHLLQFFIRQSFLPDLLHGSLSIPAVSLSVAKWLGLTTRPALSQLEIETNVVQERRATDFEAPKLWKSRSGGQASVCLQYLPGLDQSS